MVLELNSHYSCKNEGGPMVDMLIRLVKLAIVLLLGGCIILLVFQRKLMYHPSPYSSEFAGLLEKTRIERIEYKVANQTQVAFYIPAASLSEPTHLWVMFGGNGALALDWLNLVSEYPDPDAAFLLVDYPGYGYNGGNPTLEHNMEGVNAAYAAFLKTVSYEPNNLNVVGHSLGAAIALGFTQVHKVDQLLLLSPFTSMHDMVQHLFPYSGKWLSPLLLDKYEVGSVLTQLQNTQGRLKRVKVIHGDNDDIVPVTMSRELAQNHPGFVEYKELPNVGHNIDEEYSQQVVKSMLELSQH